MEEASSDLSALDSKLEALEFRRMFSGEMDGNSAFLDIQAGSGGTEAQDWADMLLRMYLRWAESHGFKAELMEVSDGEVAGIKGATIHVEGEHAFGWLRTETGVHRLVRKSPFDSGNRRHTCLNACPARCLAVTGDSLTGNVRQVTVEPLPALPQRLLVTQNQLDIGLLGALPCEQVMHHGQFDLPRDLQRRLEKTIQRLTHHALG